MVELSDLDNEVLVKLVGGDLVETEFESNGIMLLWLLSEELGLWPGVGEELEEEGTCSNVSLALGFSAPNNVA